MAHTLNAIFIGITAGIFIWNIISCFIRCILFLTNAIINKPGKINLTSEAWFSTLSGGLLVADLIYTFAK